MSFGKAAVGLLRLLSFLCSIKIINFFWKYLLNWYGDVE